VPEQHLPDTLNENLSDPQLDAGLAAAFGPDSAPPAAPSTIPLALRELLDDTPAAPHSDEPPAGTAGRNLLFGEIARGGMGAILRGRDPALGRELAVKVLLEAHRDKPELVRRFLEEAQIGGQLQHPGVVPVYELGRFDDDRPFFTMKLVKGQTLADLLKRRAAPADELPRFLTIFGQICHTVAYVHACGVIHRDLKPSNVMVGGFGEVQVMDWGMAKVLTQAVDDAQTQSSCVDSPTVIRTVRSHAGTDVSQAGAVMGTLAFMPPEQANGEVEQLDERADVFGLGAILCVILTGKPPYVGHDRNELQRLATSGELAEAFARLDDCRADAELVGLCKACLSAAKQDRPRDAGAVAKRVEEYQAGVQERLRQAELERAAAQARATSERKRRRLAVGLAASLVTLMMIVGGAGVWYQQQRTELRRGAEAALDKLPDLFKRWRWQEAETVLGEVDRRLGESGPADLCARAAQARDDLNLAVRLDAIRLRQATVVEGNFDYRTANQDYATAFGLEREGEKEAEELVARIQTSAIKEQLIAALDDWIVARIAATGNPQRAEWLLRVTRAADPDPWRDRFRDLRVWQDRTALEDLADELLKDEAKLQVQSPQLLTVLAGRLNHQKGNAVTLLMAARRRYPSDFWLNFELGIFLADAQKWEEAAGYYRAALAVRSETVAVHNNLGMTLNAKGETDEAIQEFREAVRLNPKDAMPHYNLGRLLAAKGEPDEAIREYREAIRLDPKNPWNHNNLGVTLAGKGKRDEAIQEYREAIRLDSKLTSAHFNLGNALKEKGERDEAIREYWEVIRLDPKFAQVHINLGNALKDKGERDEAIREYREAIHLDPKDALAHFALGASLTAKGERDKAIQEYCTAIQLDPNNPKSHCNLGVLLAAKGELDEAIREYREAIRLDSSFALPHINLGNALAQQRECEEAIREFRAAIRLYAKSEAAHYNLGNALAKKGEWEEAIQEYREAIRLDPKEPRSRYDLGVALGVKGERDKAIQEYREAIRLDPNDVKSHFNLGASLAAKGEWDEAIQEYQEAIRLDPKNAKTHHNLGIVFATKGEQEEAIREYREAIRLDPKLAPPYGALGAALFQQGCFAEAREAIRACLQLLPEKDPARGIGAQQLRQCEQFLALEEKLPAFLDGTQKPAETEFTVVAWLCMRPSKRLYAATVRFYAEAFDAKPELVKNPASDFRYDAACAAALAGCGQGKDNPKPDDKERARLRQQALDWLKADLALWTKQADSDKPKERAAVQQKMKHWQADADLAGVRDKDALAKLPEAERDAWRKLWNGVATVLKNVEGSK
jgi:serine/threonine-protein kinase